MPARRTGILGRQRKLAATNRKTRAVVAPPPIAREIFARTRTPGFQRYLRDLLVELCAIETTPNPDVKRMQAAEDGCFRILERELGSLSFSGARHERRPVNPAIHPLFASVKDTPFTCESEPRSTETQFAPPSVVLAIVP